MKRAYKRFMDLPPIGRVLCILGLPVAIPMLLVALPFIGAWIAIDTAIQVITGPSQ